MVALCTMAPWPRVTQSPMVVCSSGRAWMTQLSSTLVWLPMTIRP